jgi:hypothetical protein
MALQAAQPYGNVPALALALAAVVPYCIWTGLRDDMETFWNLRSPT